MAEGRTRSSALAMRAFYFASFTVLGVYLPFFPPWLEARRITGFAMGAIGALLPAMGLVGPPLFAGLADARGLRATLLRIATLGSGAAFAAIAIAAYFGHPFAEGALFAVVLVFAFFRSPTVMLADIVAVDEIERSGATYGSLRLWGSLGFLVAAFASGRFLDVRAPIAVPAAIAVTSAVAFAATFGLPARAPAHPKTGAHEHAGTRARARALLARTDFRLFLLIGFLSQAAHSNYDLLYSLHLRDVGASTDFAGGAWALGTFAEVVVMAFAARILKTKDPAFWLSISLLGAALRWLAIAATRSLALLLMLQLPHALSFGLMWTACLAYLKERTPPASAATAQGLFTAAIAAGAVLGMLVWAPLYERGGGQLTFALAAALALVAAAVAIAFRASAAATSADRRTER